MLRDMLRDDLHQWPVAFTPSLKAASQCKLFLRISRLARQLMTSLWALTIADATVQSQLLTEASLTSPYLDFGRTGPPERPH